jgi:hypothetical protein
MRRYRAAKPNTHAPLRAAYIKTICDITAPQKHKPRRGVTLLTGGFNPRQHSAQHIPKSRQGRHIAIPHTPLNHDSTLAPTTSKEFRPTSKNRPNHDSRKIYTIHKIKFKTDTK